MPNQKVTCVVENEGFFHFHENVQLTNSTLFDFLPCYLLHLPIVWFMVFRKCKFIDSGLKRHLLQSLLFSITIQKWKDVKFHFGMVVNTIECGYPGWFEVGHPAAGRWKIQ